MNKDVDLGLSINWRRKPDLMVAQSTTMKRSDNASGRGEIDDVIEQIKKRDKIKLVKVRGLGVQTNIFLPFTPPRGGEHDCSIYVYYNLRSASDPETCSDTGKSRSYAIRLPESRGTF